MNRLACFEVVLLHFAFAYAPQAAAELVSLDGIVTPAMDLTLVSRAEGDIVEIIVAELRTEVAESEMTRQEAQVKAADADVALAEIALARTSITAPFDGVVAKVHVRPGSVLAERGVPLLRIMAPSSVILVNIPYAQAQQLVGKAVTVVTTGGRECAGEVHSMAPMMDSQSQTIRATIDFEPPEDLKETFLPGLMVYVRLELD